MWWWYYLGKELGLLGIAFEAAEKKEIKKGKNYF